MGTRVWKAALAAGALCLGAVGCGSGGATSSPVQATPPASNLAGNWLLAGELPTTSVLQPAAGITATFDVSGDSVTATMEVRTVCGSEASGEILGLNGGLLMGTATSDGSFTVSLPASGSLLGTAVTVSGTIPKTPGASWTGNYTISGSGLGSCSPAGGGTFTATAVGGLSGMYTGSGTLEIASSTGLVSAPTILPVPSSMTLSLQQGGPLYGLSTPVTTSEIVVEGSVQVSGLSCFSRGTGSTVQAGIIAGSIAQPRFTMDDGSELVVEAEVLDSGAKSLWIRGLHVTGGQCAGVYLFGPEPLIVQRQ